MNGVLGLTIGHHDTRDTEGYIVGIQGYRQRYGDTGRDTEGYRGMHGDTEGYRPGYRPGYRGIQGLYPCIPGSVSATRTSRDTEGYKDTDRAQSSICTRSLTVLDLLQPEVDPITLMHCGRVLGTPSSVLRRVGDDLEDPFRGERVAQVP